MAKFASLLLFLSLIALFTAMIAVDAASKQFEVGGDEGWREPDVNDTQIYSRWAAKIRFRIGDSVSFKYKNDSVLLVDKNGYYHCNSTKPIAAFNDGSTVVKLDRSGPFYFISGSPNHCNRGQKLMVDVLIPHQRPSPSQPSIPRDSPAPSPTPSLAAPSPVPSSAVSNSIAYSLSAVVCWGLVHGMMLPSLQ